MKFNSKHLICVLLVTAIHYHCSAVPTQKTDSIPKTYSALVQQGDTSYFKGDWKNAVLSYKKALADTSSSALYNYRLGYAEYMSGNYSEALDYLKKANSLNPPVQLRFPLLTALISSFEKLNKPEEALNFFKPIVENGFSNYILFESSPLFASMKENQTYQQMIQKAKQNAFPCLSDPVHRSYDFWVGEWDVYSTANKSRVGVSSIVKDDGGCVIIEHFKSLVSPNSGHSINYVNPVTNKWEQVYSGSGGGTQQYINGEYKDSAMTFTYTMLRNGSEYPGRFIFYNQGPDQFRQYQDVTFDGGKTFQVLTDLTYKRRNDKVVF